jgi:flavin-binding protein dodecin
VKVERGLIVEYRVDMKITFLLDGTDGAAWRSHA